MVPNWFYDTSYLKPKQKCFMLSSFLLELCFAVLMFQHIINICVLPTPCFSNVTAFQGCICHSMPGEWISHFVKKSLISCMLLSDPTLIIKWLLILNDRAQRKRHFGTQSLLSVSLLPFTHC